MAPLLLAGEHFMAAYRYKLLPKTRFPHMYEYRIDKRIDQLDPIPGLGKWTEEQRQHFIGEGVIPIAGPTPQVGAEPATKKITIEELYSNLSTKDMVMMLESASALTADGIFTLRKLHSAGPELGMVSVSPSGSALVVPPGWYRYGARVNFEFDGVTLLNKCEEITLRSTINGNQQTTIIFDFSYEHSEQLYLSDIIYNDGSGTPKDVNFSLELDGISAAGASGITATLVMEIQSVHANV